MANDVANKVVQHKHSNNNYYASIFRYIQICLNHMSMRMQGLNCKYLKMFP